MISLIICVVTCLRAQLESLVSSIDLAIHLIDLSRARHSDAYCGAIGNDVTYVCDEAA
jgi:hypothetical protein